MPWWAGVLLAVASWIWLHNLAGQSAGTWVPGQAGRGVAQSLLAAAALIGQYLVPIVCLLGAATSAWRRHVRRGLADGVARSGDAHVLEGISWLEFEQLTGEAFRLQGYRVMERGGSGADGGIDLVLTRGRERFLVQCKQWKAFKVSVQVVRELYGVMAATGATGGFVVTSGRFTADAVAFAKGRELYLIEGPQLLTMIRQAKASLQSGDRPQAPAAAAAQPDAPSTPPVRAAATQSAARAAGAATASAPPVAEAAVPAPAAQPACPTCGQAMVQRTARKGARAGGAFWGCARYPACRGIREVSLG